MNELKELTQDEIDQVSGAGTLTDIVVGVLRAITDAVGSSGSADGTGGGGLRG